MRAALAGAMTAACLVVAAVTSGCGLEKTTIANYEPPVPAPPTGAKTFEEFDWEHSGLLPHILAAGLGPRRGAPGFADSYESHSIAGIREAFNVPPQDGSAPPVSVGGPQLGFGARNSAPWVIDLIPKALAHVGNCQNTGSLITITGAAPGSSGTPNPFSTPMIFEVFGTPAPTQFFGSSWGTGVLQTNFTAQTTILNTQAPLHNSLVPFSIVVSGSQVTAVATYTNPLSTESFSGTDTQTQEAPAQCTNPAAVGDDISTYVGEVYLDFDPDLDLGGGPLRLQFQRYYDALLNFNGIDTAMGAGWMDNFDVSMTVSASNATVVRFGGKTVRFQLSGEVWQLVTPERYLDQLVQVNNQYEYFSVYDNRFYTFNSAGSLIGIADRNGNQITVTPGAHGPTQASDGLGRTLTFTYTGNFLSAVTDNTGRSISFVQTSGALTRFTNALGQSTNYTYVNATTGSVLATTTDPLGNTVYTQAYDPSGRAIMQTDGLGNVTDLAYAASGQSTRVTDPLGNASIYGYSIPSLITSYTDALGRTGAIAYDASAKPTRYTDRNGNTLAITYEALSGFPASITDQDGNTTAFTYTASQSGGFTAYDLTGVTYADSTAQSYSRDAKGNVVQLTDEAGNTTKFTYNTRGQPLTVVNELNGTSTLTYNQDGTPASLQTPAGDTTTYAYDNLKRLTQVRHPDATTYSLAYDALDRIVQATDERADAATASYDANGQHTSTTDALKSTSSYAFDAAENLTAATTPAGTSAFSYNADDLVKTITAPTGETRTFGYDADLRATTVSDAVAQISAVTYDNESGLTSSTDGAGRKFTFAPDPLGLLLTATTPLQETWTQTYDKLSRLSSSTDPLGETTTYSYDPRGYLAATMTPGPVTASYTRDGLGGITSIDDPNGKSWTRAYDNMGRKTSETDPDGNTVSYTYDSRDRQIGESSSVATAQYTYDAAGNRTASVYSDGTNLAFTYDGDNRGTGGTGVALTLDALGFVVNSNGVVTGRDASSRIDFITYPQGRVTYTYNNRGLLLEVSDWAGGSVSFTYNAALQVTTIVRSNGVTTSYTYDGDGRLAGIIVTQGPVALASIAIQRDALGRVTGETRMQPQAAALAAGVASFTFDAASEVSGSTYDAIGRLTQDSLRSYAFDAASRLTSYAGVDGAASFTYDAYGMRTSRTSSGTTQRYIVNYATRMPTVAVVQLQGASGTTDHSYYVYTPDGVLLYWIDASGDAHHFFDFDEMGNAILLTADNGAVTDSYAISPYGESVTQNGTTANPYTWLAALGAMQEVSTKLFFLRARYYDGITGRFISRDPVRNPRPRAVNPYQYALGDPVDFSDPTGLNPLPTAPIVQSASSPLFGSGPSSQPPPVIAAGKPCSLVKGFFGNDCAGSCPAGESCQACAGWWLGDTFFFIRACSCF